MGQHTAEKGAGEEGEQAQCQAAGQGGEGLHPVEMEQGKEQGGEQQRCQGAKEGGEGGEEQAPHQQLLHHRGQEHGLEKAADRLGH